MPPRIANIAISVISMRKNLGKQLLLLQLPVHFSASSRASGSTQLHAITPYITPE
jgi:hypothetical protein